MNRLILSLLLLLVYGCAPDQNVVSRDISASQKAAVAEKEAETKIPSPIVFNPTENQARYGKWQSSKIGGGGYLLNVLLNRANPDILYTFSDVGGIFRSDDGGRNWRMIHQTMQPQSLDCVRDLLVDPENPDVLVAAVGTQWAVQQGLFKSTDGGLTWTRTLECPIFGNGPNRSTGRILQRSPRDPDTIFAATGVHGLFKSTDGGGSWQYLGLKNVYVNDFKIDCENPDRMFLCANARKMSYKPDGSGKRVQVELQGGFYRSEDGGVTWEKLSEESPWELQQNPVDPERWHGIFQAWHIRYSDDAGKTWQEDTAGLELAESKPSPTSSKSYKAIGTGPDFLVIANGAGDFFIKQPLDTDWRKITSTHQQGTWYNRTQPDSWDHFGRATACVVIDPQDPNHWFFTDYYALYQSWDAGASWTLTIDGIENTVIHTLAQAPQDTDLVHMGMADNGYFRSKDGGRSFEKGRGGSDNCKAIAVAPSLPSTLYILAPKHHGWYADTVYVSQDNGRTFSRSPMTGVPQAEDKWRVNSLAVDTQDAQKLYIGVSGPVEPSKGGVWVSTNGGESWIWDGEGLPGGAGFFQSSIWDSGMQLARSSNGSMVAVKSKAVYFRNRDGQAWQKSDLQPRGKFTQIQASPGEDGVYYLAEQWGGLHRSDDNGRSWSKIFNQGVHALAIDTAQPDRIAVALDGYKGIFLSTNRGKDWNPVDPNIPQRNRMKLAFAGNRLVASTPGNGVFILPLSEEFTDY